MKITQLTAVLMKADHYKITSDKPAQDGGKLTYTVGYHQSYNEANNAAETLSKLVNDVPFRVYRYSAESRNYMQETYWLNGE